jgi:hypothetical protein
MRGTLAYVRENRQATLVAAQKHMEPLIAWPQDLKTVDLQLPFLGRHQSAAWKLLKVYPVKFKRQGETISVLNFANQLQAGRGYAVVSLRRRTVLVGEFEPVRKEISICPRSEAVQG